MVPAKCSGQGFLLIGPPPQVGPMAGYGQPQPETNQLAIWSLVASLVGILCTIGSLVGIALGVIALNQIKERRQGGHGEKPSGDAGPSQRHSRSSSEL